MLPHQESVEKFYNSDHIQVAVAVLIGANFLTNIIEKEIDPHTERVDPLDDKSKRVYPAFEGFELFYNICFTLELIVNLYGHWFKEFWKSRWNVFDVVVVSIGVINTIKLPLPSAFSMLRMMRAFRVFRLFKRVHSLNKIITAIAHAVPGVANAFLILAIIMSIYAILAVEFYYEMGNDCLEPGGDDRFKSSRGYCTGEEYFGTFSKSLYTFFQVLTGESWSEAVARPAIWFYYDDPLRAVAGSFFFVSYFIITAFVLTNVVVAVLLDKMVDPEVASAAQEIAGEEAPSKNDENGEGPKPTAEDLTVSMNSVNSQVEQLMTASDRMSSELNTFRTDMAKMREQIANVIQCVPGGNGSKGI